MSVVIKIFFLFFKKFQMGLIVILFVFIPTAKVRLGGGNGEDCREGVGGVVVWRERRRSTHTNGLESVMPSTNKTL